MKEAFKQFLMQKFTEKWVDENPALIEDIESLVHELATFNLKWKSNFTLKIDERDA